MFVDPSGLSAQVAGQIMVRYGPIRGPWVVGRVNAINNRAVTRTATFMETHGYAVNWGNTADAYRHFIGNFYMTRELGLSTARFVSNANEMRDPNLQVLSSSRGVVTAMINGLSLQDLWNDAAGQNAAVGLPNNTSSRQAFDSARLSGNLITNAETIWQTLGIAHLQQEDNGWRVRTIWNQNDQTVTFTDRNGNNAVTFRLGGVLPRDTLEL